MKMQCKTSSFVALICCCLISGCSEQDKPGPVPSDTQPAATQPAATQPAAIPLPAANEKTAPAVSKNIFQPSAIDPVLVRQSMQARSEYEEMNRKIMARMNRLYEENSEINDLQIKMRELREKIDALLAEDEELIDLKKKLQSIAPEIPTMPPRFAPRVSTNGNK